MRLLAARTHERERSGCAWRRRGMFVVPLCLMLPLVFGCAAVLTPLKPGANEAVRADEGLIVGRLQLMDSAGGPFGSPRQVFRTPFQIQWRLKERTSAKEFVIDGLPQDGPFAVKLPPGSYELTALSFDTGVGIWQASLPAAVTVTPRNCTYLGTWELRAKAGFFDGFIVRHVVDQHTLAVDDLKRFLRNGADRRMVTELSGPMTSPLILTSRTQGTDLTSPP